VRVDEQQRHVAAGDPDRAHEEVGDARFYEELLADAVV
jgi:hypothetical protein